MAISNYVRPHLEVHQMLQVTQQATGDRLGACVVGANYALYRYGQEELEPNTFSSEGMTIPFEFEQVPGYDYDVDPASVAVNAEGLEASLATFTQQFKVDTSNVLGIRLEDGSLVASNSGEGLNEALKGLSISVGDIAYVKTSADGDDKGRRRTVTGLLGKVTASVVEQGESSNDGIVLGTAVKASADASYTGKKDTTYVLQVVAAPTQNSWAGVQLKATDTVGADTASFIALTAATVEGQAVGTKGLKLDFTGTPTGIAVGDTFSFICLAPTVSTTEFDGVILDAMPVDVTTFDRTSTIESVEFRKTFTGEIPSVNSPEAAWTATAEGVVLDSDISLYLPDRSEEAQYIPFEDGVGNIFVSYRVLIIPLSMDEDVHYIETVEDIQNLFGTIDPANDLAFGCACALDGSAGRAIYAIRTAGTDAEAFTKAVKKTEADSSTYSFAILTDDKEVMDAVVEFNNEQSQPEVMKWRRTILGVDAPGEYQVASVDAKGQLIRAAIVANTDGKFTLLQVAEDSEFTFEDIAVNGVSSKVHAGDKIQLLSTGAKYTIAAVLSPKDILLESGPASAITVAAPISVWKANTPYNAAEYVTSFAKAFNTRRALVVWCDQGTKVGSPEVISNKYLAAEIAGLSSAVVPQQGITRFELVTINRAPRMYTQYTQKQLDDIAKEGVLVVTQNVKNGPCFIRHQLTTETDKGSLYYEDSCTRNIDNISYAMADILEKYIGKANVTPTALTNIELEVAAKLDEFLADSPDDLIGPSLIKWDGLTIVQDHEFEDRVIVNVNLYLPLPLNVVKLYEMAYIAQVTINNQ